MLCSVIVCTPQLCYHHPLAVTSSSPPVVLEFLSSPDQPDNEESLLPDETEDDWITPANVHIACEQMVVSPQTRIGSGDTQYKHLAELRTHATYLLHQVLRISRVVCYHVIS